ncbi:MAG: hypothetical protein AAF212_04680 [Verrucomicrobiota bacterium]
MLRDFFVSNGFSELEEGALFKNLNKDFYIKIAPEEGNWIEPNEIYLYLYSPPFASVMESLFADRRSWAWSYLPRKLRKDSDGCLGMILCGIETCSSQIERSRIIPSSESIMISDLMVLINSLESDADLFESLYRGELKMFFALIEGLWVYLYFAFKLRFPKEKILAEIRSDPEISRIAETWRLKREVDRSLIDSFGLYFSGELRTG